MEGKIYLQGGERDFNQMIAQAIPTYTMSIFKLPKALCDSINSTLAKYWWGQRKDEKKIHGINWRKLRTKKKKTRMGFRDIQAFNLAMLAKQAWRLIHHTHSIFYRVHKARYFPNCSFMEAKIGHNPSFVWRSLVAARDVIMEGSRWRVGNWEWGMGGRFGQSRGIGYPISQFLEGRNGQTCGWET